MRFPNNLFLAAAVFGGLGVWLVAGGKLPLSLKDAEDAASPVASAEAAAPAAAPKPPSVTVIAAKRAELVDALMVSGTLVPREEIIVAPEVDGLSIVEILVEEGERVEKGQVLARLTRSTLEAQIAQVEAQIARTVAGIAQAKAQIAEAEASRTEAVKALERARILAKSGTVSAEVLDQRQSAAGVAEAKVASAREGLTVAQAEKTAAEAQLRELNWRLARTEIRAPTAGVVSRRSARMGAIASMAGDATFRIIEDGAIELEADVADLALARLEVGQLAHVTPSGANRPIAGKVRRISPEVDRTTRLGKARIALDAGARPQIGAFAGAVVEVARREGVTLPISAVSFDAKGASVQVVEGDTVRTRRVTVGLREATRVEIAEGLKEGDVVVARAGSFLRDGDRITAVKSGEEMPS